MTETAMTIPSIVIGRYVRGRAAANVLAVLAASLFIAIAAQIAIPLPFTPVPLTLQPIAVLLVGVALGSTRGAAAVTVYLLEGFAGLPVFAQGHGGAMWLFGATAGYLFAYPAAAFVAGLVAERGFGGRITRAVTGMLLALGIVYLGGWSWLAILTGPGMAFTAGVAPFVVADIVKVALAAALLPKAEKLVRSL